MFLFSELNLKKRFNRIIVSTTPACASILWLITVYISWEITNEALQAGFCLSCRATTIEITHLVEIIEMLFEPLH